MIHDKEIHERAIRAGFGVVWRHLTRPKDVARFHNVMADQLHTTIRDYLGNSVQWKNHQLFPLLVKVVARIANRTYYGLPLCV